MGVTGRRGAWETSQSKQYITPFSCPAELGGRSETRPDESEKTAGYSWALNVREKIRSTHAGRKQIAFF